MIHFQSPSSNVGAYLPATSFHPSRCHKSTLAKSKASLTAYSILNCYSLCNLIALLLLSLLSFPPFHLPSRNLETTLYSPFPTDIPYQSLLQTPKSLLPRSMLINHIMANTTVSLDFSLSFSPLQSTDCQGLPFYQ